MSGPPTITDDFWSLLDALCDGEMALNSGRAWKCTSIAISMLSESLSTIFGCACK